MRRIQRFQWAALAAVAWVMASPATQACAVCFGKTDSPLGKGLHWGVLALLGFIFAVLAVFGAFAVYLVRRSIAVEAERRLEEGEAMPGTEPGKQA